MGGITFDDVQREFLVGLEIAIVTVAATAVLELFSWETAKAAYAKDKKLYLQGVAVNFVNHFVYGIPIYMISALFFIRKYDEAHNYGLVAAQVVAALLIHSIFYYHVHKTFHSCPGYYRYHKFHHRFNTHVTPISANAVGFVEYIFAYIIPFSVAGAVVRPYADGTRISIYLVSTANIFIHTPVIEAWSERNIPSFWVGVHDHMEHHRKLNIHYAAPTVNLDWAVEKIRAIGAKSKDNQDETAG